MIKIFGRQLFFRFNHFIYNYDVKCAPTDLKLRYEKITDNFERIDIGYFSIRMLKKVLKKNPVLSECYMFTTEDKSEIVGFALVCFKGAKDIHYRIKKTDVFVTALGVFKNYRGKGYSQEILKGVVNICSLKGLSTLSLSVDSNNVTAINAYEKFGFVKKQSISFIRFLGIDFLFNKGIQ